MKNTLNSISPPSARSNVVAFSNTSTAAAAGDTAPVSMPLQKPFADIPRPSASRYADSDSYTRCPYGETAAASIFVAGIWFILYLVAVTQSHNSNDLGAASTGASSSTELVAQTLR